MNLLVLGSGGREHALAWKLKQSPLANKIFLHPGNAGTLKDGFLNFGDTKTDYEFLVEKCRTHKIDLIVIGPETFLEKGYTDRFEKEGILVFGPRQSPAQLEISKHFAKEFLKSQNIPTADYAVSHNRKEFEATLKQWKQFPVVLKADGLKAGKGVVIANTLEEAVAFPFSGEKVVFEEFLDGKELSYIGLCDSEVFIPLSSSSDFKRVFDDNQGPNTGGMGVISPSPLLTESLETKIQNTILRPLLKGLSTKDYRGTLYIGILVQKGEPFVLEFNARFGDPETQALMVRLKSDLLPALLATAKKQLKSLPPLEWEERHSLYVVCAAQGYPGDYQVNDLITGIENVSEATPLFFSGVSSKGHDLATSGGRVLGVAGLGNSLDEVRNTVYREIEKISFAGMHYRKDIGIV